LSREPRRRRRARGRSPDRHRRGHALGAQPPDPLPPAHHRTRVDTRSIRAVARRAPRPPPSEASEVTRATRWTRFRGGTRAHGHDHETGNIASCVSSREHGCLQNDPYLDLARLRGDTGFEPQYSLEAGIREYVAQQRRASVGVSRWTRRGCLGVFCGLVDVSDGAGAEGLRLHEGQAQRRGQVAEHL